MRCSSTIPPPPCSATPISTAPPARAPGVVVCGAPHPRRSPPDPAARRGTQLSTHAWAGNLGHVVLAAIDQTDASPRKAYNCGDPRPDRRGHRGGPGQRDPAGSRAWEVAGPAMAITPAGLHYLILALHRARRARHRTSPACVSAIRAWRKLEGPGGTRGVGSDLVRRTSRGPASTVVLYVVLQTSACVHCPLSAERSTSAH